MLGAEAPPFAPNAPEPAHEGSGTSPVAQVRRALGSPRPRHEGSVRVGLLALKRRTRLVWSLSTAIAGFALSLPATADAGRVLVLEPSGHVVIRHDPLVGRMPTPVPAPQPGAPVGNGAPRAHASDLTVRRMLERLVRAQAISTTSYLSYLNSFNSALKAMRRLSGTRATELGAVITNLHNIAAAGLLTPSRLPALFMTLDRNRKWWTTGHLLSSGQRVKFAGSQLVWEYYPGQGIELQELGSFGPIDSLYRLGPTYYPRIQQLLDELIPLAAQRGGGIAWEYYFKFDGGTPPWTSAMSQGTAVQALAEAYEAFHDPSYLELAHRALPIFRESPPLGVGVKTRRGRRYLLYSFAPNAAVINGFLQALIGLFDYAEVSGDAEAQRLFDAGNVEAQAELPHYDTGTWSLYEPGQEDTRSYHELVTEFLDQLCSRTDAPVYCKTAARFHADLKRRSVRSLTGSRTARRMPSHHG
jgi:D-glucuronyl C5-epimerase C-terminus